MADEQDSTTTTQQPEDAQAGAAAEPKNTDTPGPVPYDRFKKVNEELAEMRAWRKEREAEDAKAAKAAKASDEKRLAQQQEWQTLAEQREARIAELEQELTPVSEDRERYKTALSSYLTREREGLPEATLELLDELDAVKQLEWIAKHREDAAPYRAGINAGDGRSRRPAPVDPEQRAAELRQRFRL